MNDDASRKLCRTALVASATRRRRRRRRRRYHRFLRCHLQTDIASLAVQPEVVAPGLPLSVFAAPSYLLAVPPLHAHEVAVGVR